MKSEKSRKNTGRGRRKAYVFDDSCVICGSRHVETGRIFHGHCVCDECVEYILNRPEDQKESVQDE